MNQAMNQAYIIMLSHILFQGCFILLEADAAFLPKHELEHLVTTRFKDKLRSNFLAMGFTYLIQDEVNPLTIHLHSELSFGVINYACSHSHM